jgi:1-acyl-sn-glycerol-3-phosphate acyltransferase
MLSTEAARIVAVCVLVLAGLAPVIWALVFFRRMPLKPAQKVVWGVNYLIARLLWRTRVESRLQLPAGQGAVIVANHRSSIDPCFIEIAVAGNVHWMVAKEYCQSKAFGWFLRIAEVIPTNRGGIDTASTKMAIRIAQEGGLIGVFPEGRINTTADTLLPGRPGAAMIALKAKVPVIPCYIAGSPYDGTAYGALLMSANVRLRIGRPIDLSPYYDREGDREVLEDLTRQFLKEIARLAGDDDFEPQLAGRFYKPIE